MENLSTPDKSTSEQFRELALKVFVKVVLKSALWFGLAWLLTRFLVKSLWPWYAAFALVGIGLFFSFAMLCSAFFTGVNERKGN
jgi:hypothetical protein